MTDPGFPFAQYCATSGTIEGDKKLTLIPTPTLPYPPSVCFRDVCSRRPYPPPAAAAADAADASVTDPGFPFALDRSALGTIEGDKEAFYAVLSANYLEGRIDAQLHPTGHDSGEIGALDMGEHDGSGFVLGGLVFVVFPKALIPRASGFFCCFFFVWCWAWFLFLLFFFIFGF